MAREVPVTVVETPEFRTSSRRVMNDADRMALIDYLAYNPTAGDLIQGTGGVRKLRWALQQRGKRGGARVIYYYHSAEMPLFVLTVYVKSELEDLSQKDRNDLKQLASALADALRRGR